MARRRYNVIGNWINCVSPDTAMCEVDRRLESGDGGYVCFVNVHLSVTGRQDAAIQGVLNNSWMSMPDGKPLSWVAKIRGIKRVAQVAGPDFMLQALSRQKDPPVRHYFYGARPEVLEKLVESVSSRFPFVKIAGYESPPFRELTDGERDEVIGRIRNSGADIVWVGLGAPKQELWMADNWEELKPAVLMGVGAGFDFHSDAVKRAPEIIRKLGLEWLHRLFQEPRRLWLRYFVTNSLFIWYLITDSIKGDASKRQSV